MSFEWLPNAVQIPKELIQKELEQELPDATTLAAAAIILNQGMTKTQIMQRFGLDQSCVEAAWSFLRGANSVVPDRSPKPNQTATNNGTGNATRDFAAIICQKTNESFPQATAMTLTDAQNLLKTATTRGIEFDAELLDTLILIMQDYADTKKPIDYAPGFMAMLLNKRGADQLHAQGAAIRAKGQTTEGILKRTLREANQQVKEIELPSPSTQADLLKKMRERATSGDTLPGTR